MRGAILYAPGDIRLERTDDPKILEPTDAIIRLSATCVCGSDLWPYRGIETYGAPVPMGHEYVGIVEDVGSDVTIIKAGQFVIGSFFASDNTCEICRAGYQSSCLHRELVGAIGTQADYARIPLADGTLVATPDVPPDDLVPSFLAASDVLGTGWFGAVAADVGPGKTVAVVGDGAVGLLGVLASTQLGAERIIVMSRHESRQKLALEFGATDIVEERTDEGAARIKDLTDGLGAHSTIEAVGTRESMLQAVHATRPGGHVGYVGVTHGELPGDHSSSAIPICTAALRRFAGSCPSSSISSGTARSRLGRSSTSPSRWTKSPRATGPCTNAEPSRRRSRCEHPRPHIDRDGTRTRRARVQRRRAPRPVWRRRHLHPCLECRRRRTDRTRRRPATITRRPPNPWPNPRRRPIQPMTRHRQLFDRGQHPRRRPMSPPRRHGVARPTSWRRVATTLVGIGAHPHDRLVTSPRSDDRTRSPGRLIALAAGQGVSEGAQAVDGRRPVRSA
jgi:threonine dehydrogenase-like Zn-dependent dehydrogenase